MGTRRTLGEIACGVFKWERRKCWESPVYELTVGDSLSRAEPSRAEPRESRAGRARGEIALAGEEWRTIEPFMEEMPGGTDYSAQTS